MASEQDNCTTKAQLDISCNLSREPSTTISTRKAGSQRSHQRRRNFSFQEGQNSPASRSSMETSKAHRAIERTPSQFNAAFFDRQSIRSSRSCSNLSQRDLIVQDYNAVQLYNPYYQQQPLPQHPHSLALAPAGGEYLTVFPPQPFFPPPPNIFWYQQCNSPPPFYFASQQIPPDFKTFKRAMKLEKKRMESESKLPPSMCAQFCCSSVAQILWAIIALACFGLLTALIFALFLVK